MSPSDLCRPYFFCPNRVWRCYSGGRLLDSFLTGADTQDDFFPEEWIASVTPAVNREHQQHPDEGLSRVCQPDGTPGDLFCDLLQKHPELLGAQGGELNVLCKFLDSAIRLPIQCHPDRAFAKEHYHSPHGKTESWFILDSRSINGEEPYLLMGFKPEATREAFEQAILAQDIVAACAMLHRVPARAGEMWFIPGRLPHAIGPGVCLLEVQEPTDWVVQPEAQIGPVTLSEEAMWGPITPELGLACFDLETKGDVDALRRQVQLQATVLETQPGGTRSSIIDAQITDCFRVQRIDATATFTHTPSSWQLAIVTQGQGHLEAGGASYPLRQGSYCFLPHGLGTVTVHAEKPLSVFLVEA